jgi:flagellar biosynthesis anti-sigma factor FlgM
MKIAPVSAQQIMKTYGKTRAYGASQVGSGRKTDEVEISNTGKTFASAVKEVKDQLNDTTARREKVQSVSQQLEAGSYAVDSRLIADKILGR